MGYSWAFLGDARIPAARVEAWLRSPADPALSTAELDAEPTRDFGLEESSVELTVSELFDELRGTADVAHIAIEVPAEADAPTATSGESRARVVVRVLADKSGDPWLTFRANLVAAFVALRSHGGSGRLDIVGFDDGPDEGFRLDVDGEARARSLGVGDVEAVRASAAYRELIALGNAYYGVVERNAAPPPAPVAPAPGTYLDHALRTIADRVLFDARDGLRRTERRILWALHLGGECTRQELAGRVSSRHPGMTVDHALGAIDAFVQRRGSTLSLIEELDGSLRLSPLAREALDEVGPGDLVAISDDDAEQPRVVPLRVPWLLVAGGQAIGVGLVCKVPATAPGIVLAACLGRLANPRRAVDGIALAPAAHVLVDGEATALDAAGLVDAFLAGRAEWIVSRGDGGDAQIARQLTRWLGSDVASDDGDPS